MKLTNTDRGTFFDAGGRPLQHAVRLEVEGKPGSYSLCWSGKRWELFHTAAGNSQSVAISDGHLVRAAVNALLAWHKSGNNCPSCVEAASGNWDFCDEAQTLFVQS